ncbi:hypothetical protein MTYP_02592 [Methylophilaceae bacterium]|nr:hypothetical protein MTYP_02592 [Methylophilaceae bacterium]
MGVSYWPSGQVPPPESERFLLSLGLALALHAGLILVLPHLEYSPAPVPIRVEVQLAQMREEPASAHSQPAPQPEPPLPIPKPVTPQKPVQPQREVARQVLAASDEAPPTPEEMTVLETPAPSVPVHEAAPSAPVSAPAGSGGPIAEKSNDSLSQASSVHAEEADPTEAWDGYGQKLYDLVSRNKSYPQIAVRRNWQGMAMVSARFSRGRLVEIVLLEPGSGHKVLDDAALEMLKKAVSALPVNGDLKKKSFTVIVPVDFKLEG